MFGVSIISKFSSCSFSYKSFLNIAFSTLAAYCWSSLIKITSSPESASIINSLDSLPPIAPESASTITTSVEHLENIFL